MDKYRKKPVVIEAEQYDGENYQYLIDWIGDDAVYLDQAGNLSIRTLEGRLHVTQDDWIIKGVKGEFYPCKPDIFAATYELVEEN